MRSWIEWEDDDLRLRRSEEALARWERELGEDVDFCVYTQYLFSASGTPFARISTSWAFP